MIDMAKTIKSLNGTIPQPSTRALAMGAAMLLLAGLAIWILLSEYSGAPAAPQLSSARLAFESQTGIRITRVVLAAAGGVVDIHYQVLDPDKALVIHDTERPPFLIAEANGATLSLPFHNHVSVQDFRMGGMYRLHIMNRGSAVHVGQAVTIVIGDARLEHIPVEK